MGLREAEFAQITRATLFDVSWPQGGKPGTLTGAISVLVDQTSCQSRVRRDHIYQNTAQLPPGFARWLGRV
jgi:hypothetical protein